MSAAGKPMLTRWARAASSLAATKPASWFFLNVANRVDRHLLPLTKGRVSLAIGQPILCIEVAGAKTGKIRRTPLLFTEVGGDLVIIASATGRPGHPAWYRNVSANPRVKVYAPGGRTGSYTARTAEGEERERLWNEAVSWCSRPQPIVGRSTMGRAGSTFALP